MKNKFQLLDMQICNYQHVLDLQLQLVDRKKNGSLNENVLIIVEHFPVFTLGNRGGLNDLKVSTDFLLDRGIEIIQSKRGGFITYHGPGQIVAYPIINLHKAKLSIPEYIFLLEEVMLETAQKLSVTAQRHKEKRGIWIENRKIGSVGIAIKKGITYHGLALNINTDLEPFSWINPCGLADIETTSIFKDTGIPVQIDRAKNLLINSFNDNFGMNILEIHKNDLHSLLMNSRPDFPN